MGSFNRIGPYEYTNITSATTTTVKSGPGTLHTIQVNGGTLGAITIYDNITNAGTKIATITPPAASTLPYAYDVRFGVGLTIVTAGATDVTVVWD